MGIAGSDLHRSMARLSRNAGGSTVDAAGFKPAESDVRGRRNVLRVHHFVVSILFTDLFFVFSVWPGSDVPSDPTSQVAIIICADPSAITGLS